MATEQVPPRPDRFGPGTKVALLGAGLFAGGAALLGHRLLDISAAVTWSTLVIALMFAVAEVGVLHIQVRREAQTISLGEIPLVFGLRFLPVPALMIGRLVGSLLVFVLHRRQRPIKVFFNCALVWAGTAVAVVTYESILELAFVTESFWVACFTATAAASCLDALLVTLAILCYEPGLRIREMLREILTSGAASALVTVFAVLGADSFAADRHNVGLLVGAVAVLMVSYRAYASLQHRHLSMERLYRFSQVVSSSPEVDEILRSVLVQARELLRADVAEVTFLVDSQEGGGARAAVGVTGVMLHSEARPEDASWLFRQVVDTGASVLLPRGSRDPALRSYLSDRGMREALVVPLRGDAGVVGTLLVADRMGAVRTFDAGDVLLLETVGNHAGVALQNGRLVHRLRHDSLHDALTGLPNRVMYQGTLSDRLHASLTDPGVGVTAMLMDLDRFKEVNDTLGHAAGDRLLQEMAVRLSVALGEDGLVARLGGDEFALLLDTGDEAQAVAVARRLLAAVEQPVILGGLPVSVGASIGVALAPQHGTEASELLKHADIAMYQAKSSLVGMRLFDADRRQGDPSRLGMVSELREALQERQLAVYVQPKTLLADGSITSVEALVRWRHPTRGLVSPDEFVPLAERSGLIEPLTLFMLENSLAACAAWAAQGHRVGVAVNLSAQGLAHSDLVASVQRMLRRYALEPGVLTLEITESCIMTDPTETIAVLEQLRDMGVRLSVDDFGTGYSSLSYLRRLPVREVKIDRSFVSGMPEDPENAKIVRSIIMLGRSLGLEVVAEGVEDRETWTMLQQMGCTYAQGYLISMPLPVEDFIPWLRGHVWQPAPRAALAPL